jgi:TM2 domain-containing membrane protein YozV
VGTQAMLAVAVLAVLALLLFVGLKHLEIAQLLQALLKLLLTKIIIFTFLQVLDQLHSEVKYGALCTTK